MSVQVHIKAHMRNQETTEEDSWPAISLTWCENSLPMKNDLVRIVSHDHGNDPKCVHVDIDELRAALDSIDAMRKSKEAVIMPFKLHGKRMIEVKHETVFGLLVSDCRKTQHKSHVVERFRGKKVYEKISYHWR